MNNKNFVDGASLLGVALTVFSLRGLIGIGTFAYWLMVTVSFFLLGSSIYEFWLAK